MHLGNCVDVLPTLAPVEHVITDPPFEFEAHTKQRRSLKDATQKKGAANTGAVRRVDAVLPFAAIDEKTRAAVSFEFARMASRWVLVFCQAEAIAAWRLMLESAGLDWVRAGVWIKPNGMPQFTGDRPGQGYESIAIAHPKGRKRWNGGGSHGVWNIPLDHNAGGGGKSEHPTKKADAIMLALVEDFTDEGETILDPFAGSGTTLVAALRLGRKAIGIEKDPKYFQLACDRLRAEESSSTLVAARAGQTALFAGSK